MAENTKRGWIDWELYKQIRASMPLASVDLLTVHEGRLLLMRRVNEPGRGVWFVPGGRVRYGETLKETGLTPVSFEAKGSMCHFWTDTHYVTTFFRVDVAGDVVRMDDEHDEYVWVSELHDDAHPLVREMAERAGIFEK